MGVQADRRTGSQLGGGGRVVCASAHRSVVGRVDRQCGTGACGCLVSVRASRQCNQRQGAACNHHGECHLPSQVLAIAIAAATRD